MRNGMSLFQDIVVEREPPLAVIRLNRPEVRNAIRPQTVKDLLKALKQLEKDGEVKAIILTGGEGVFSAGADIKEMSKFTPAKARSFARTGHKLLDYMETYPKPIVVAMDGAARAAGLDLAMAGDYVIASDRSNMGWTMINVGVITALGGNSRALRILGLRRGKAALLATRVFKADEALQLGLVDEVVPAEKLMERAREVANELASKPPLTYAIMKKMIKDSIALSGRQADAREIEYYARCFRTRDTKEALTAFLEKRKPVFTGK